MQTLKVVRTGRAPKNPVRIVHPAYAFTCLAKSMARLDREHFVVLHLDNLNYLIGWETVSIGTQTQALVRPREVFTAALLHGSAAVILAHNHPSGRVQPSPNDIDVTERLHEVGELLGIAVRDHVIVGRDHYYSFATMHRDWPQRVAEAYGTQDVREVYPCAQ